ncbi:MAG: hypothetical protein IPL23_19615 [Saprospiraceae bacterium]|nr:hypothetical protein [Saprospiraceae bacterium]
MDTVTEKVEAIRKMRIGGKQNEAIREFLSWEEKINSYVTERKTKGYDLPLVDTIGKTMYNNRNSED